MRAARCFSLIAGSFDTAFLTTGTLVFVFFATMPSPKTKKKQAGQAVSTPTPQTSSTPQTPSKTTPHAPPAFVPQAALSASDSLASFKPEPERYDPSAAKETLAALLPRLLAYPQEKVAVPRLDVRAAAFAALGAHALATQADVLHARFQKLQEAGEFDMASLGLLRDAAFVVLYAHAQAEAAGAFASDIKVPASVYADATTREARMQALCEYMFGLDPQIKPLLDLLRPGTGYRDVAGDLIGYADIYDLRPKQVASDTTNFDPTDAAEARRLAGEIYAYLIKGMSPKAQEAYGLLLRAWTLLAEVYAEVQAAGLFLLRRDPARTDRFPSLYTVARAARSRAKKAAPEGDPGSAPPNK